MIPLQQVVAADLLQVDLRSGIKTCLWGECSLFKVHARDEISGFSAFGLIPLLALHRYLCKLTRADANDGRWGKTQVATSLYLIVPMVALIDRQAARKNLHPLVP